MSMILDALKRSREDMPGRGGVPSVDAQHYMPDGGATLPLWVRLAGAAALLVIGGLVYLLLVQSGSSNPQPVAQPLREEDPSATAVDMQRRVAVQAPVAVSPKVKSGASPGVEMGTEATSASARGVPGVAAKPNLVPASKASAVNTADPAIAALYQQAPSETASDATANARVASPSKAGSSSKVASPSKSEATKPSAMKPESPGEANEAGVTEQVVDVADVLRRAQKELGEGGLIAHPVPLLDALSQQQKDKVPTVLYTGHDFNPSGESAVVLNGDRLTVGQRNKGFLVKEILVDSVILSWGGTDFRLRALNSWVNL